MNKETFDLILRMRDQATAVWQKTQAGISGGVKRLGAAFGNLRNIIAAAFAIKVVKDFISAHNEQEKASAKLAQALSNVGVKSQETQKWMENLSSSLQKTHGFGDDVITNVQAMIVAMTGLTGKAVEPLVKATLDLAKARGMDAMSAADLITKTIAGQDALGRYGISVKHATTASEKMSEIVRIVGEQFGGMAENEVKTAAGQIEQFNLKWGDLQEEIGGVIKQALVPFLKEIEKIMPVVGPVLSTMIGGFRAVIKVIETIVAGVELAVAAFNFLTERTKENAVAVLQKAKDFQQSYRQIGDIGREIRTVWADLGKEQTNMGDAGVVSLTKIRTAAVAVLDPIKQLQFDVKWTTKAFNEMSEAALKSLPTEQVLTWSEMQHVELQKQLGDFRESKLKESEVLEKWYMRAREMAQGNVFQLEEIDAVYRERKAELDIQTAQKVARQVQQLTSQLTNVLVGFSKNKTDAEIADLETRRDAALEAIDAQLASETISEEERNRLLDIRKQRENEYQNQIRAAKQRQFQAEKTAATIQSIIQTAVAVVEALPNIPLAIAVGILGVAQTAVIAGQPTPRFHGGGSYTNLGPDERQVIVRQGERVNVEKPGQERGGGNTINHIHINLPFAPDNTLLIAIKRALEEGLRRTGQTMDEFIVESSGVVLK